MIIKNKRKITESDIKKLRVKALIELNKELVEIYSFKISEHIRDGLYNIVFDYLEKKYKDIDFDNTQDNKVFDKVYKHLDKTIDVQYPFVYIAKKKSKK